MVSFDKRSIRSWSLLGIAPSIFINAVSDVMRNDEDTYLLTADTGRYCGFQKMDSSLSDRIINVGIAEQNMIGIAAGLALEGKKVIVTTYAPFLAFRCADQVRHLAGNCNLNIKMVGTAAGFSASASGGALLAINDIALMRAIPNMTILSPADCTEAMKMMLAASKMEGPVYVRFCGLTNLPIVYNEDYDYVIGKPDVLNNGCDIAILATGTTIVAEAIKAADIITKETGINPTIVNMHTIKPIDEGFVQELSNNHHHIFTVEEHSVIGGLGSAVSEVLTEMNKKKVRLKAIGVEDKIYKSGDRKYMLQQCNLTSDLIARRVISEMETYEYGLRD